MEIQNQKQVNILENLQISIDSLVVDTAGEFFAPNMLYAQAQSSDGKRIFSFYEPDFQFFEISLEEIKPLNRHSFEREGPNGSKRWVVEFQMLAADEILAVEEVGPNLFFLDRVKTKEYALDCESILGFKAECPFSTRNDFYISPDKSKFLSLPMSFGKPVEGCSIAIDRGNGFIRTVVGSI